MKGLEKKLRSLSLREPSEGYVERVLAQKPEATVRAEQVGFGRQVPVLLGMAASLVMAIGVIGVTQLLRGPAEEEGAAVQANLDLEAKSEAKEEPLGVRRDSEQKEMADGEAARLLRTRVARKSKPELGTVRASRSYRRASRRYMGDGIDKFSEGLAAISSGRKGIGYIDLTGKWVIEPRFSRADKFAGGIARVRVGQKNVWIDRTGKEVDTPLAAALERLNVNYTDKFSEGLAVVNINGKYGYINRDGKLVIEAKYDEAKTFSEGVAAVGIAGDDKGIFYIDKTGRVVIEPNSFAGRSFYRGLAGGEIVGTHKWGFIDHSGKIVRELPFEVNIGEGDHVWDFQDGLALVRVKGKSGYIDAEDRMVIKAQFERAFHFSEGMARVFVPADQEQAPRSRRTIRRRESGKWGYIDRSGKFAIPVQFDDAADFSEGLARVRKEGFEGFINHTGETVIKLELNTANNGSLRR